MVTVPVETGVTTPEEDTVAIAGIDEDQVPPPIESVKVTVAG